MGGHSGGDIASTMAIEILKAKIDSQGVFPQLLKEAFAEANEKVRHKGQLDLNLNGMGTTLTAAVIEGAKMYIAHVGDSRAYLLRESQLTQITRDHSLVAEMIRQGKLSSIQSAKHPHRNVLMQAVGTEKRIDVELHQLDLRDQDLIILCTDGLSNLLTNDDFLGFLQKQSQLQSLAEELVKEANQRGGHDNITVVMLRISLRGRNND